MGIAGTVLAILVMAAIVLIGWGVLMLFARGMSDVPMGSKKKSR